MEIKIWGTCIMESIDSISRMIRICHIIWHCKTSHISKQINSKILNFRIHNLQQNTYISIKPQNIHGNNQVYAWTSSFCFLGKKYKLSIQSAQRGQIFYSRWSESCTWLITLWGFVFLDTMTYDSAYLPSEFRTSQPRLYVLIRLQQSRMIISFIICHGKGKCVYRYRYSQG